MLSVYVHINNRRQRIFMTAMNQPADLEDPALSP
jgi:hypothetical protein